MCGVKVGNKSTKILLENAPVDNLTVVPELDFGGVTEVARYNFVIATQKNIKKKTNKYIILSTCACKTF